MSHLFEIYIIIKKMGLFLVFFELIMKEYTQYIPKVRKKYHEIRKNEKNTREGYKGYSKIIRKITHILLK